MVLKRVNMSWISSAITLFARWQFVIIIKDLQYLFSFQLGEITEIRLVKNQMGKSKGFAYVEFKNQVRKEPCY